MRINIGIENGIEGRTLAWALDYPGCFAYGADAKEALMRVPRAFLAYHQKVRTRAEHNWLPDVGDFDVRVIEAYTVYDIDEDYQRVENGPYSVNAWFSHDWKPLTAQEVRRVAELLRWGRADLLKTVEGLPVEKMEEKRPGERWSINGILGHVAGAEWWYMDRLGLAGMTRAELPKDAPFERLKVTRDRLEAVLPELAGMSRVWGVDGEFWSPRKLVRRALWHELDHIEHIEKLIRAE